MKEQTKRTGGRQKNTQENRQEKRPVSDTKKRRNKNRAAAAATAVVTIFPAILILLPLAFLLQGSFMGTEEAAITYGGMLGGRSLISPELFLARPSLKPWSDLLLYCGEFYQRFWNTVGYTALIVGGQLAVSLPAAWGFAKEKIPFGKVLFAVYLVLMMLPFQVTMLSGYFLLEKLALLNTPAAFLLPAVFSTFPVFLMTRFFSEIPEELLEAARIDGAGEWAVFRRVGLPAAKAGIAAVTVLQVLEIWNTMEQPMFYIREKAYLPLALFFPNLTAETFGSCCAAAILMLLPPMLVFLIGQKELEEGIRHIGAEK